MLVLFVFNPFILCWRCNEYTSYTQTVSWLGWRCTAGCCFGHSRVVYTCMTEIDILHVILFEKAHRLYMHIVYTILVFTSIHYRYFLYTCRIQMNTVHYVCLDTHFPRNITINVVRHYKQTLPSCHMLHVPVAWFTVQGDCAIDTCVSCASILGSVYQMKEASAIVPWCQVWWFPNAPSSISESLASSIWVNDDVIPKR